MAVANYHETYGCLPPAYIADSNGKPMHSWRVLILPFLDYPKFYKRYKFDEPWNGPNNSKLALDHNIYWCPSHGDESDQTCYVAVTGAKTAFPAGRSVTHADLTDGPSNTIAIVEIANSGIHWMEPRDLSFDDMSFKVNADPSRSISSLHELGANVLLADWSTRFLGTKTPEDTIRSLLTIDGAEAVGPLDF